MSGILEGLKVLVLEDEFLIAMDVEQLCLDHGASAVTVARKLSEVPGEDEFHAAVVDVLLDGVSTLDFADGLRDAGKPFIFASGYTDNVEVATTISGRCPGGQALFRQRPDPGRRRRLRPRSHVRQRLNP